MIVAFAIAATIAASAPTPPTIADTAHAIAVGRLDQARLMLSTLVRDGAKGPLIDRLMADLAFASGKYAEAGAGYRQLLLAQPADSELCERAGISAFKLREMPEASRLLDCATSASNASWRAWNARGAIADMEGDWAKADDSFTRAAALAPSQAEVINNQGWSQLMRGNWKAAEGYFEQAMALHPASERVANNLELAKAALQTDLPQRLPGENDQKWAARLNDVGVAAELMGDRKKAVAAFTQALETSGSWYERAANNLKAAEKGE